MTRLVALRDVVRDRLLRWTGFDIRSSYVDAAPDPQHAIDLFRGEWASRLPGPWDSGMHDLFKDSRIEWLIRQLGNMQGRRVLDCGPLEGGHAYMLERAGADVLGVEANTRAFLRCLVAREVLGMHSRFMLGSFIPFLRQGGAFDVVVASGVLYHLMDPVEVIESASRCTDYLYIWTHYYSPGRIAATMRFAPPHEHEVGGFRHRLHRQFYQTRIGNRRFFGGAAESSCWLERDGLLGALEHFGFKRVTIHFDDPGSVPGPSIALLASKDDSSSASDASDT